MVAAPGITVQVVEAAVAVCCIRFVCVRSQSKDNLLLEFLRAPLVIFTQRRGQLNQVADNNQPGDPRPSSFAP